MMMLLQTYNIQLQFSYVNGIILLENIQMSMDRIKNVRTETSRDSATQKPTYYISNG